jgi:hypothetical protein
VQFVTESIGSLLGEPLGARTASSHGVVTGSALGQAGEYLLEGITSDAPLAARPQAQQALTVAFEEALFFQVGEELF